MDGPVERLNAPRFESGDPRAHKLLDMASGAVHPRAIRLCYRALGYGRTGIQASKAYQELGMRFEDLGQTQRAIRYYTRSLKVGPPNPWTYFWRGLLYHQQGHRELARNDFEQALALDLWPPECDEARQYLIELS